MRAIFDRVEVSSVRLDEPRIEDIYLEKIGGSRVAEASVTPEDV